jgi:hypothetical protein
MKIPEAKKMAIPAYVLRSVTAGKEHAFAKATAVEKE